MPLTLASRAVAAPAAAPGRARRAARAPLAARTPRLVSFAPRAFHRTPYTAGCNYRGLGGMDEQAARMLNEFARAMGGAAAAGLSWPGGSVTFGVDSFGLDGNCGAAAGQGAPGITYRLPVDVVREVRRPLGAAGGRLSIHACLDGANLGLHGRVRRPPPHTAHALPTPTPPTG